MARDFWPRPSEDLIAPSVEETIAALDPPAADAALVRTARLVAAGIDAMEPELRATMLPQHVGILLRALDGLEKRAAARQKAVPGGRKGQSELDRLRKARVSGRRGA